MGKRDDERIRRLAARNAAKPAVPRADRDKQFDSTLKHRPEEQSKETKDLFKEMKRREF